MLPYLPLNFSFNLKFYLQILKLEEKNNNENVHLEKEH